MMRKIAIVLAPLLLLALIEIAFRLGVWEPLAAAQSHAGASIRLKQRVLDPSLAKIDFVTLGSSRPEYGIDHARIAAEAKSHGYIHANLSMAGSHWMTIGVLSAWLHEHHPEIRGGIIALAVQDLAWKSNGYYELGIVQPLRTPSGEQWIETRNPFDRTQIDSYGSRFALFEWREDVRDFFAHPISRLNLWRKSPDKPDSNRLFENSELTGDMCHWGLNSLDACARVNAEPDAPAGLKNQCSQIIETLNEMPDYAELAKQNPVPQFMQETRDLTRRQLRELDWPMPPVVVLMPMPKIWFSNAHASGWHQWALDILQPLDAEGSIHLIDATTFFDDQVDGACSEFADFYHQNAKGRAALMDSLLPKLDLRLYQAPAKD
ncbi:MAG: hypothetical protein IPP82_16750 [Xanthomonadales bacterium]|nr:hypothetical protein [Xanthomonadales bacterium]